MIPSRCSANENLTAYFSMPDTEVKDSFNELELKIECRRSLYEHAVDSRRRRGWSAAEWEEWTRDFGAALVEVIGDHELECIVKVVWKLG